MSRFKKPPIVEAWIAFDFEPAPDKVDWDMQRAQEFVQNHRDRFPKREVLIRQEFKVEESQSGDLPRVVSQERVPQIVRLRNDEAKRILQVADDQMAFNLLQAGPDYPGFEVLIREALDYAAKYREFFRPAGIRQATIHYTDMIMIPTGGNPIDIEDYFTLARDLPQDPYGLVAAYSTSFATQCPFDGEPLQISLAMIPTAQPETIRFRMDWEKGCGKVDFSSRETIREGLYASHEFMVDCFEASIMPRTRALFEPVDENETAAPCP